MSDSRERNRLRGLKVEDSGPTHERRVGSEVEGTEILRAKYHDYCSAQLADLLVYLSPDEIYLLAQKAGRELGRDPGDGYAETVALATEWLSRRMPLPPFDVWVEDYKAHPELYDTYFMGLWESEMVGNG